MLWSQGGVPGGFWSGAHFVGKLLENYRRTTRAALTIGCVFLMCVACDDDPGEDVSGGQDTATDVATEVDSAGTDTASGSDSDTANGSDSDGALPGRQFPEAFVFGAASAAHQIEGGNTNNNWYQFETLEIYEGAIAAPSGMASNSFELWETDNQLVEDTNLDAYRFSIEWSRIEPTRGVYDDAAIAHYRAILVDLRARGIEPWVTLHHFTDPIWLQDLSDLSCASGPTNENLCGWTNPDAVAAFVAYAGRMAQEYGDLVDQWTTFNEPNTYSHVGYFLRRFPPGNPNGGLFLPNNDTWTLDTAPVVRALVDAHAGAYDAIHTADTTDANGDDEVASVGWTVAAQYLLPGDPEDEGDVEGATQYRRWLNYVYPDAIANGGWDHELDGTYEEAHPEWRDRQDWIGVQYYSRIHVIGFAGAPTVIGAAPCQDLIANLPACPEIDPNNLSFVNEVYPEGLYEVVAEFAGRYPGLSLPITENGAAANNGERKAQILVRHLAQVHRLVEDGLPVSAYFAWSLTDNFEWADGFEPRFGLYEVDYESYVRTPTMAQEVYAEVAGSDVLSDVRYDALANGPLLPDDESPAE